jgi:hypothetical protein
MLTHMHPSLGWFTCKTSSNSKGTGSPSSESEPAPEPPSAQSPFARLGSYLRRRDVQHLVRERYPSFIALTDSCARPKSSHRLRLSLFRPVFAGCCQPLLEDGPSRRYLHSLCKGAWTHTPPRSCRSVRLDALALGSGASIAGHRPHFNLEKFGTRETPCNATSTGGVFSRLQSFADVQAPLLARPPGCTNRCDKHRAAGPFTSRNEHVVTRLETLKVLHEL